MIMIWIVKGLISEFQMNFIFKMNFQTYISLLFINFSDLSKKSSKMTPFNNYNSDFNSIIWLFLTKIYMQN